VTTSATLLSAPIIGSASASADPCPAVDVTFARGTGEPPGVGAGGQQFLDSLRSQVGGQSVGVYAVNYPAGDDLAPSASAGANDAHAHVRSMVASCPDTKLVLGGYSQGAGVIDLTTIARMPISGLIPDILTADEAEHVAALALFGNPTGRFLRAPVTELSPWYGARTIDLCAPGDPVCAPGALLTLPSHDELFSPVHLSYEQSGIPRQAATFVVGQF
jgi:cutinase